MLKITKILVREKSCATRSHKIFLSHLKYTIMANIQKSFAHQAIQGDPVPPHWVFIAQWRDGHIIYTKYWTGADYVIIEDVAM